MIKKKLQIKWVCVTCAPLAGEAINLKSSNPKRSIVARGSSEPLQYVDTYGKVCSKSIFPKNFLFVYLLAKMSKKNPKS